MHLTSIKINLYLKLDIFENYFLLHQRGKKNAHAFKTSLDLVIHQVAQQKKACFVLCFFFTLLTKKNTLYLKSSKKFSLSLFPSTNAKKKFFFSQK